jgi:hypothetical protein
MGAGPLDPQPHLKLSPDYSQGTARCAPTAGIAFIEWARRAVPIHALAGQKYNLLFYPNDN